MPSRLAPATSNYADFRTYADRLRPEIEAALDRAAQFGPGCGEPLRSAVRYSLLGSGKRLRPMLALLAAESCGQERGRALPAACAVEMVHAYSLIHDDLPAMDDDDLRRGRPTCHKQFDEATAILAGDALLARAFEILATEFHPRSSAAEACALLAAAAGPEQLVGGQCDDLVGVSAGADVERLESIHRRKTGAMFRASLELGALAAEADAASRAAIVDYAQAFGLAFQITDDLLDVGGEEQALGKRVGKDADRGKLTFPALLGVEESRRRATELVEQAHQTLAPLGDAAAGLHSLARFVVERNR